MSTKDLPIPENVVHVIDCKQHAVRAVRFNVDGNYCLTCGSDKSLKLWNPHTNKLLKTYNAHGYDVLDAQSSCDNSQLCSCGTDKTVILWDVGSGKVLRKFRGHVGVINCVKFNEESTLILSGSIDGSVRIWDCRGRRSQPIQILDEAKDSVTSIQVSDYEILTGSADGRTRRYDLRNGRILVDFVGKSVTSANFTKDGQCILVSTLDSTLRLFDKDSGEMLNEYTGHTNKEYKTDNCLNSDDSHLLNGSEDGAVYVWNLTDAKVATKLQHPGRACVNSLTFHPTEVCLLTAYENKVFVWKKSTDNTD